MEFYDLEADTGFSTLLPQKIAVCTARKCGVEDDAAVGCERRKSVFHQLLVGLFSHLRRVNFVAAFLGSSFRERNTSERFANVIGRKDWPVQLASQFFSDSGFAGADSAHHDQNERLRAAYRVLQRETKIARRLFFVLLGICRFFLRRLNAFHLAAHEGAVALVEIRDLQHARVVELARGISEEQVPQVASAFEIKIHRQEREIVGNVDEAKPIVKLDAIEDSSRFRREMDVVEVQIPMTIANAVLLNPLAK